MVATELRPETRPSWRAPLLLGAGALVGCAYVAAVDPNTSGAYPFCPFRVMTGYDCPGCGVTRAVRALLGGDVLRAADHNVLWTLTVPFLVYGWVVWMAAALGHRLPWPRGIGEKTWLIWPVTAVLVGFWVARNVAGADGWLASGA